MLLIAVRQYVVESPEPERTPSFALRGGCAVGPLLGRMGVEIDESRREAAITHLSTYAQVKGCFSAIGVDRR